MKSINILTILSSMVLVTSTLTANAEPVATMKSNAQIKYFESPKETDSIAGMFKDGMVYGRLRSNTFYYWWDEESSTKDTHLVSGLGGSLVYESAKLNGFDFAGALYYSYGMFDSSKDTLANLKAGKDIFSRFNVQDSGSQSMAVVGQAYLRYKASKKSEIIVGRQLVESFYTKSNDTKMIPNTFDGVLFNSKDLDSTYVKLGYLSKQKLRDHTKSHSVLRYDGWSENDDSAMHKGMIDTTNSPLIIGDIKNKSIKNLSLDASFYVVAELVSQLMTEINYKMNFDGFSITPGFRYIKQIDDAAGEVGGASLKGDVSTTDAKGYTDPTSLDAQMIAARIVSKFDNYKINLGYTNILDEADLVTPWRGFPTAGYTRSMARYNWRANTKSYRLELVKNTSSVGLYSDTHIQASIMYQDDDINKYADIDTDSYYYYIGFMQNLDFLDNAQWRYRFGYQDFVSSTQVNNIDTRFELNYFF